MKGIFVFFIVFLSCIIYPLKNYALNNTLSKYVFSTISIDEGLPINFIDDLYKDSKGFLWVSTQGGGLSRYDGYEFIKLDVNSSPVALKSNFVRKTCEDNFNRLWIISDLGLDIIDLKTMQKSNAITENQKISRIGGNDLHSVHKDNKGNVWITGDNKIYRISFDTSGTVKDVLTLNKRLNKGDNTTFTGLVEIDNEVWVARQGIVYNATVSEDGILFLHPAPGLPDFGKECTISSIIKVKNHIWIGTDRGLFKYNAATQESKWYFHSEYDPETLTQNMITDFAVTQDGSFVISTLRGLNFYDPSTDRFERISHTTNTQTINSDFINCLLSDGNVLWIGTEAGGINKMTLPRLIIHNYIHNDKDRSSISSNPVNAITEDNMGNLWVGSVEGGLNLKRKGESEFRHYTYEEGLLSHNTVSALEEDGNNNLWIGTWGKGLNILNLSSIERPHFRQIIPKLNNMELTYISSLNYDKKNNGVWIGAMQGICFYDLGSERILSPLPREIRNRKNLPGAFIDSNNILWTGTENGLIMINLNTLNKQTVRCAASYLNLQDKTMDDLFLKNVTSIYQSKDGKIWLGSKGYGFCILEKTDGRWKHRLYTTNQGLANNMVLGILEDQHGTMWMSTGYGISSYNPQNNRIVNYTKNDGLNELQFYWNASYKSPSTHAIYFGSMNGLTEIQNRQQPAYSKPPRVVFTKLQVLNKTVWTETGKYLHEDISYTDRISLHENDKSFSVEFSALDYDNPQTVAYSYRLVGFDNKWVDVPSNRRFASFTNLQPGTYTLQVRSISPDNKPDNGNITELTIQIRPYFYKTFWFISLSVLVLAFIIFRLYRWRISMLKKQKDELHHKVIERTKALENQKHLLVDQAEELKRQNEILIEQNGKILNQRKQLIKMSDKIQEAMNDKVNFFTNITHEFRTPITLIMGPIDKALKLSTNPRVIEQLQYVSRNSRHLLSLVNQLMDFRKVESEQMGIMQTNGNFVTFLDELIIPFDAFAYERNIRILKYFRLDNPCIMFDEEAMLKVISNLLSNALKFTPENGIIRIYVTKISNQKQEQKLYISVSDDGQGIEDKDITRIFDRFYQSKNQSSYTVSGQSGTGIGLYLCKNIIELQDGVIYAKNNPNKGSSFRILLPLETEEASSETIIRDTTADTETHSGIETVDSDQQTSDRLTILVAEDNIDMRSYISSILSDYYRIVEAGNGEEAVSLMKQERIDFIVSDLMMPVMDGLELSQKVKEDINTSHIPFLMLTAKTSKETRLASYRIGVDEYLNKPFDEDVLLTRIHNILETRKLYQRRFGLYMNIDDLNIEKQSKDDIFLSKALEIIKKNYKNPDYEVSNFIRDMNVSKSLMHQKMQTLAGQSAGQFIRSYRLNLAREILLKNQEYKNLSVAEIAYEVGFNDPKYFTRCFTKQFGLSPSVLLKSKL